MRDKIRKYILILSACLPAIILITWLNAYYWLLEDGRYKAFIQPKLWPLLILALILLLAFTAAFISQFSLKSMATFQLDAWFKAAILIVPVVFLWTIYGQSLGTDAFAKRSLKAGQSAPFKTIDLEKIPSPAPSGKVTSLLDLILYAEKFKGKPVAVEGMVFRGAKESNSSFTLFRFAVACCAADALPFSIKVKAANEENLENDTWVRVVGHFNFETVNNKQVLTIAADKVLTIPMPPPEKRYLFF